MHSFTIIIKKKVRKVSDIKVKVRYSTNVDLLLDILKVYDCDQLNTNLLMWINSWDENQFIRTCYLNLNWDEWMVTNKMFDEYIERIREQAFKNWYTEEDLEKIISYWKAIAMTMDGLEINLD